MFYRDYDETLKHCESTAQFCTLINDMFDALNKTLNATGLTLGCAEMKVCYILHNNVVFVHYFLRKVVLLLCFTFYSFRF